MHEKTQNAILACVGWRLTKLSGHDQQHIGNLAAKFLTNDVSALLNDHDWNIEDLLKYREDFVDALSDIIMLRHHELISSRHAKEILLAIWRLPYLEVSDHIIASRLLEEADDNALTEIIAKIITDNPKVVEQILSGKAKSAGFLVGQAMKAAGGKADPSKIKAIIETMLAA